MMKVKLVLLLSVFSVLMTFTASLSYGMSSVGYLKKGEEFLRNKQYDKAIEYLTIAIESGRLWTKDLAITYSNRGIAYAETKELDKALADFNKAVEVNPDFAKGYYNKACAYSLKNNPEEACVWLKTAIEKGFSDWDRMNADKDLVALRETACYKGLMPKNK